MQYRTTRISMLRTTSFVYFASSIGKLSIHAVEDNKSNLFMRAVCVLCARLKGKASRVLHLENPPTQHDGVRIDLAFFKRLLFLFAIVRIVGCDPVAAALGCSLPLAAAAAAPVPVAAASAAREGRLRMTVVADYVAPVPVEVASQEAVDALISNVRYSAKTEQDRLEMFQLATEVSEDGNSPFR